MDNELRDQVARAAYEAACLINGPYLPWEEVDEDLKNMYRAVGEAAVQTFLLSIRESYGAK